MDKLTARVARAEKQIARKMAAQKAKRDWRLAKQDRQRITEMRKEITNEIKTARVNQRTDWELGPLAPARHLMPHYGLSAREPTTAAFATHMQYGTGKGQYKIPNLPEQRRRTIHDPVRLKIEGWKPLPVDIVARRSQYEAFMKAKKWRNLPKGWRDAASVFQENLSSSYWLRPDFAMNGNHFCVGDTVVITKGRDAGKVGKIDIITDDGEGAHIEGVQGVRTRPRGGLTRPVYCARAKYIFTGRSSSARLAS